MLRTARARQPRKSTAKVQAQLQMQTPHDYVVYVYWRPEVKGADRPYKGGTVDMHAGESETAHTMVTAPGLVHTDRAQSESALSSAGLNAD